MLRNIAIRSEFIGNEVFIKREDLIHDEISGNKFRKLKYNLEEALRLNHRQLLTFGGAYSNHIAAVAACGKEYGFKTIGVIRGEELKNKVTSNETLSLAKSNGMIFEFVSRENYRLKDTDGFISSLRNIYGGFYLIPEGGTNALAVKGCEEILNDQDKHFDYVCCAVGTGGTISGIINSAEPHQKILGFPALKGDFLTNDIRKFANHNNWDLITEFHFGGYAKVNTELITFINDFKLKYNISLDPIYTGKMMYGIFQLKKQGYFPESAKVLAIHTGGLQGIKGMNKRLKSKGLPLIDE